MDARTLSPQWQATAKSRKGPWHRRVCHVQPIYDESNPPFACGAPDVLMLSVTTGQGALASWCNESWFNDRLSIWGYATMEVVIAPTPGALLHKQLHECLFLVRRVAKQWRLIGQTDGSGLASMSSIDRLLNSAYDELQWILTERLLHDRDGRVRSLSRIVNAMRELIEIRDRREQQRPAVIWQYDPTAFNEDDAERLRQMARQVRVDRLIRSTIEDK